MSKFFWPHFKLSGKKEAGRTNWWLDLITIVSKIRPKEGNAVLPEWKCIFEKAKKKIKEIFFCFWCHCVWWSCIDLSPISDQFGFICNKFDSIKKDFQRRMKLQRWEEAGFLHFYGDTEVGLHKCKETCLRFRICMGIDVYSGVHSRTLSRGSRTMLQTLHLAAMLQLKVDNLLRIHGCIIFAINFLVCICIFVCARVCLCVLCLCMCVWECACLMQHTWEVSHKAGLSSQEHVPHAASTKQSF